MKVLTIYTALTVALILTSKSTQANTFTWAKVPLNAKAVTSVETARDALFVGENDNAQLSNNYNGVFVSYDLGDSWKPAGLSGRGVTDLKYSSNDILYASTRFVVNATVGLFSTSDNGTTWEHYPQIKFGINSVDTYDDVILVGGTNNGLWISQNRGETWEQKIGTGFYGPQVYKIKMAKEVCFAATDNKTYISTDLGKTWQEITTLNNKRVRSIEMTGSYVFLGTNNSDGMFVSKDKGTTWENVSSWGTKPVGAIYFVDDKLFASGTNQFGKKTVFVSTDLGQSWEDTNLTAQTSLNNAKDLMGTYVGTYKLFVATEIDGVYETSLSKTQAAGFLEKPWISENTELLDSISAYFDHSLPLLGYKYFRESEDIRNTIQNYQGAIETTPTMYYSSHNGYDFKLPYETKVTAPFGGWASYYFCEACGNTIKINHLNGYETSYMHLLEDKLVTKTNVPVWVNTGDTIGYVGLSGNTTGPHLHFSVRKDLDGDGSFAKFPDDLVDPFGWTGKTFDPWSRFTWVDLLGEHVGSISKYLWSKPANTTYLHIKPDESIELSHLNKKITVTKNTFPVRTTLLLQNGFRPNLQTQDILSYITNTAFSVNAYDLLHEEVSKLSKPIYLHINFSNGDLINIALESIKLYTYIESTGLWEELPTLELDIVNKTITAYTTHLSKFALLGQKIDTKAPEINYSVSGDVINGWILSLPTITLTDSENDLGTKIFTQVGHDTGYSLYDRPLELTSDGVYGVSMWASDAYDNWNKPTEILLRINSKKKWYKTIKSHSSKFEINK